MKAKKTMWSPDLKRVAVYWEDACTFGAWMCDGVEDMHPSAVVTLGWLIRDNEKEVVVAGSMNDMGHYGEVTAIPAGWVLKIERL